MSKKVSWKDFEPADPQILELILAESTKRIESQVQIMLAGDARANGLLAASTTLAAAGLAVAADQFDHAASSPLFAAAVWFAAPTVLAACASVWALWPTGVDLAGWSPHLFVGDIEAGKPKERISSEIACKNQEKLSGNDGCIRRLASRARVAMALLASAPVAGASGGAMAAGGVWHDAGVAMGSAYILALVCLVVSIIKKAA